jgi:hypothetical protein
VSPEIGKYIELLEQRLGLLRALAEQLVSCRKEFVEMDLDGIYGCIGKQEDLCRRIQSLQPSIESLQRTCGEQLNLARLDVTRPPRETVWAKRLWGVQRELGDAQAELGRLNWIHAEFLRRSRLTVTMFANLLENCALTYTRPAVSTRPARLAERG